MVVGAKAIRSIAIGAPPLKGSKILVLGAAYMGHHQAMSLVAVANVVFDGFARRLFHAEPSVQAAELLLHERGGKH